MSSMIEGLSSVSQLSLGDRASAFVSSAALPAGALASATTSRDAAGGTSALTMDQVVQNLQTHYSNQQPPLVFRLGAANGDAVVLILDARDGSLVREMPSKDAQRMAAALSQLRDAGALVNEQV